MKHIFIDINKKYGTHKYRKHLNNCNILSDWYDLIMNLELNVNVCCHLYEKTVFC